MTNTPSPLLATRRLGKVTALPADTSKATITIGGDIKEYDAPFADGYRPLVGDDVIVLSNQGTHYILGTAYGPPGQVDFSNTSTLNIGASAVATYTTVPSTISGTFTKRRNDTRIRFDMRLTGFALTSFARMQFGVAVNDVAGPTAGDFNVVDGIMSLTSNHMLFAGLAFITGVPAGDYNFRLRFFRVSGTGTFNQDGDDYVQYEANEVV